MTPRWLGRTSGVCRPFRGTNAPEATGAVTVVVTAVLVLATLLAAGVLEVGAATTARARAQTAADASALAAADILALGRGSVAARRAAEETASDNGAQLVTCSCTGRVVDVEVSRQVPLLGGITRTAKARARAEIRPLPSLFARKVRL